MTVVVMMMMIMVDNSDDGNGAPLMGSQVIRRAISILHRQSLELKKGNYPP